MKKTEAIDHFGSVTKLAEALNITSQAVSQWSEDVPLLRTLQIEKILADPPVDFDVEPEKQSA